jgi:hypothetical protein
MWRHSQITRLFSLKYLGEFIEVNRFWN